MRSRLLIFFIISTLMLFIFSFNVFSVNSGWVGGSIIPVGDGQCDPDEPGTCPNGQYCFAFQCRSCSPSPGICQHWCGSGCGICKDTVGTGCGTGKVCDSSGACVACIDLDGDGYGNPGNAACPSGAVTDCDDDKSDDPAGCPTNKANCAAASSTCAICINPGAAENTDALCSDTKDNNCNGNIDCADSDCGPDSIATCCLAATDQTTGQWTPTNHEDAGVGYSTNADIFTTLFNSDATPCTAAEGGSCFDANNKPVNHKKSLNSGLCCGNDPNEFYKSDYYGGECTNDVNDCVWSSGQAQGSNTGNNLYWCYLHEWNECIQDVHIGTKVGGVTCAGLSGDLKWTPNSNVLPENQYSCTDGLDNDGDGYIDCADSDCDADVFADCCLSTSDKTQGIWDQNSKIFQDAGIGFSGEPACVDGYTWDNCATKTYECQAGNVWDDCLTKPLTCVGGYECTEKKKACYFGKYFCRDVCVRQKWNPCIKKEKICKGGNVWDDCATEKEICHEDLVWGSCTINHDLFDSNEQPCTEENGGPCFDKNDNPINNKPAITTGLCCGDDPGEYYKKDHFGSECVTDIDDCVWATGEAQISDSGNEAWWCFQNNWEKCNGPEDVGKTHGTAKCAGSGTGWTIDTDPENTYPPDPITACSDGLDNDADKNEPGGGVDCTDSDCAGTISGIVKDEENNPLDNVRIDILKESVVEQTVWTDNFGNYIVDSNLDVICGRYDMVVSKAEYVSETQSIDLQPNENKQNVDFTLVFGTICEADCTYTGDNIIHQECQGINGCDLCNFGCSFCDPLIAASSCDLAQPGWIRNYDDPQQQECQETGCSIECGEACPVKKIETKSDVTCDEENLVKLTKVVTYKGKLAKLVIVTCG